ncbi:ATP-dependent DNA helicase RecG [Methyloceanibacter sp.]|uniref:ATP-dependent DNA helicase RecG n=1 Tax=Methyloceanibacter sp. TaxID=1965321 RepID=UPI002D5F7151|nr:ATP-dependent DNA helicase RecG [Methyloceanibacter sp.]HZP09582.1 ATP-dependent DNA helicase RecG [Methyloceanibacter sp.]
MRPAKLAPLFATVRSLKGVGPKVEGMLNKLLAPRHAGAHARLIDLLWHLPVAVIDRAVTPRIAEAKIGEIATVEVTVAEHRPGGGGRRTRAPYKVLVEDVSGASFELVYFNADPAYLRRLLPVGGKCLVSGKLESYDGWLQMPHPDHVVAVDLAQEGGSSTLPLHEPVYPLTAGLTNSVLRKAVTEALSQLPRLPEWIDETFLVRNGWPSFVEALRRVHAPEGEGDLAPKAPARMRLAYDELLANQLALAVIRQRMTKRAGRTLVSTQRLRKAIIAKLPFKLTGAQVRALGEIDADLASPHRMLRLLQGDVGSGKTVVALLALAGAVEAGAQGALMAPTELLARQHMKTIGALGEPAGLRITLLTGRERGREREAILARLERGEIDILIGTHALFQEPIRFRDLGLVVIDEQHRFGVHQRLALQGKGGGSGAELLVMTATPIPRTLLLTSYGDMDVSRLDEKPPGRKPVATATVPLDRLDEVIERIGRAIASGTQIYWVCPLVEESEQLDLAAAKARHADLAKRFGDRVGLVHGRLAGKDKDRVMAEFGSGALAILVSTTVIEVGVDVPNASIMIIEHAERFGLAQLHQLRGRVGRGAKESSCILLYRQPLSETARERLSVMRRTEDGFVIAEEDLRLRGGGEVLGTKQSGLPAFRIASLPEHELLLQAARDEARLILARDPELSGAKAETFRLLLYLFERDDAVRLMRAG